MLGGLLMGLAEEVSTQFIPSEYKGAVSLMLLVMVLLIRPQGLFGGARP
jgi:branched-subunit amino acid ABC-type transport system permease component